jgi:ParB/RepB/Spo0J family partition protein
VSGLFLVDIELIDDDPLNPRGADVGDVGDLKQSIAQDGLQDPVQLIQKRGGRWQMHEGHRRKKAHIELGEKQIKAIKRTFRNELDRVISQGVQHLHAKEYSPMAWARYLHRLCFEMPPGQNLDRDQVAHRIGRHPNWVRDTMALYHLTDKEQRDVDAGRLTRKEALRRLAVRRAANTGKPAPTAPRPRSAPAGSYFNGQHPLAEQVAARCASGGLEHAARPKIGRVGCGPCWEDVIGDNARVARTQVVLAA